MQISLAYPGWFVLLCLALGAAYAAGMYWRHRSFPDEGRRTRSITAALTVVRFAAVSLLAFLLLAPMVRDRLDRDIEPVVAVLTDNSASLVLDEDSGSVQSLVSSVLNDVETTLNTASVEPWLFDGSVRPGRLPDLTGRTTDLQTALRDIEGMYYNRNLAAVVVVSDGRINTGLDPLTEPPGVPVFTVGTGDTSIRRDVRIARVLHNEIGYLDEVAGVEILVDGVAADGQITTLTVEAVNGDDTRTLQTDRIAFDGPVEEIEWPVNLDLDRTGIRHFRVTASAVEGERALANNVHDFYIDVIDGRRTVLLLADAPHPDLGALRRVLESTENYEAVVSTDGTLPVPADEVDLAVVHGLPVGDPASDAGLTALSASDVPRFFIVTGRTDAAAFNSAQDVVRLPAADGSDAASALVDMDFSLFALRDDDAAVWRRYPPVEVPFGEITAAADARVLMRQRIGSVETDRPILAFRETVAGKTGVFVGDGLWRWRMVNALEEGDHQRFDGLFGAVMQYMALQADKRRFRVDQDATIYDQGRPVQLTARLYDANYEPVEDADVDLDVQDAAGRDYPLAFQPTGRGYSARIDDLPPGDYTYRATTRFDGEDLEDRGAFTIRPFRLEARSARADHDLLRTLSQATGGRFFHAASIDGLAAAIDQATVLKPVVHSTTRTRPLVGMLWPFLLILALLTLEWFVRKWMGTA